MYVCSMIRVDILPAPVTEIFLLFYQHANPIPVKQCLESRYRVSGQGRCPGRSLGEGLPGSAPRPVVRGRIARVGAQAGR